MYGSGTTALVISNEKMNDIMKIVQALGDSGVSETTRNQINQQNRNGFGMMLGTLAASLIGNLLKRKGAVRAGEGTVRLGEGTVKAGEGLKKEALILPTPNPLINTEIEKYYKNECRFNGVYSRDNFPEAIKNGGYIINLDEYADVGTHWVALYVKNNEVIYFDSFGVEHIPKEVKKFIRHKNIKINIFRIQADNSIMCGYFCGGFIGFMLTNRSLIDFTSLFSPYDFRKNDKIMIDLHN